MGAQQSSEEGGGTVVKACYYDLLGVQRDATDEESVTLPSMAGSRLVHDANSDAVSNGHTEKRRWSFTLIATSATQSTQLVSFQNSNPHIKCYPTRKNAHGTIRTATPYSAARTLATIPARLQPTSTTFALPRPAKSCS